MDVHRAIVPHVGVAPHQVHQALPAVNMTGILHQQLDEVKLLGRQINDLPVPDGHALLRVQAQSAHRQKGSGTLLLCAAAGTAQQGTDAGNDLPDVDGLGHVVIRTAGKAHELVLVLTAGGEHDDGHIGKLPDLHARLGTGQHRHHQIQNNEIELPRPGFLHGSGAVIGHIHLEPFVFQIEPDALDQQLLVVNHQYLHVVPPLPRPEPSHTAAALPVCSLRCRRPSSDRPPTHTARWRCAPL